MLAAKNLRYSWKKKNSSTAEMINKKYRYGTYWAATGHKHGWKMTTNGGLLALFSSAKMALNA